MPDARGTVTLGAVTLVANLGGLAPLQAPAPETVHQGIASTTIQTGTRRIFGTPVTLRSAGPEGWVTTAILESLQVLVGTVVAYTDTAGTIGTVHVREVRALQQFIGTGAALKHELEVAGTWITMTQRLGVAYAGA